MFVKRMLVEYAELKDKLEKLTSFIDGEVFASLAPIKQSRMRHQVGYMESYLWVLGMRIKDEGINPQTGEAL